jgi:hypothetical protein
MPQKGELANRHFQVAHPVAPDTHCFIEECDMVENVNHISDEALERCSMLTLPRHRIGPLEDHLLICSECQDRLQAEIDFVTAMRGAAKKISEKKRKEKGVEVLVFTAGHSSD